MKRIHPLLPVSFASALLLAAIAARADTITNTAIIPVPRTNPTNWLARHEGFVKQAQAGGIDLLFMGDSITDGWRGRGQSVWQKYYGNLHAANFGIGGDQTQHVLWRLDHGEVDGIKPKVTVLMIGTNNTGGRNKTQEIVEGVTAIVKELRHRMKKSKVLLLAIFPRAEKPDAAQRQQIREVNLQLAQLDDGKWVKFLDIGPKFLQPDGTLTRDIMPDFLHPNQKGYQIWADAMEPTLTAMMK